MINAWYCNFSNKDCLLGNSTFIKPNMKLVRFQELSNTGTYMLNVTWIPLQGI